MLIPPACSRQSRREFVGVSMNGLWGQIDPSTPFLELPVSLGLVADHRVSFYLYHQAWAYQPTYLGHGAGGSYTAEILSVDLANGFPIIDVGDECTESARRLS